MIAYPQFDAKYVKRTRLKEYLPLNILKIESKSSKVSLEFFLKAFLKFMIKINKLIFNLLNKNIQLRKFFLSAIFNYKIEKNF